MRWLRPLRIAALALIGLTGLLLSRGSFADLPLALTYQGVLLDPNSQPITGTRSLVVSLWTDPFATDPAYRVYEEVHLDVRVLDGAFEVRVGEGRFPSHPFTAEIFDADVLWVEVEIGSETLGPRKRLGSVARAIQADKALRADSLAGLDAEDLQRRVIDTCPAGSAMRIIPADGSPPICESDDDTQYTAGAGLSLSGNQLSIDPDAVQLRVAGTCPAGSSIRVVQQDGTVTCEVDSDANTTYSAGTGLALAGTSFGIATGGVAGAHLDATPAAVTGAKLATDAVDTRVIALDTLTAADLDIDSVTASEIRPGAVGAEELGNVAFVTSAHVADGTLTGSGFAPTSLSGAKFSNEAGGEAGEGSIGAILEINPVFVESEVIETPPGGGIAIVHASGFFSLADSAAGEFGECEITTGTVPLTAPSIATIRATNPGVSVLERSFLLTGGMTVTGSTSMQFNVECRRSGAAGNIAVGGATIAVLFLPTRY